MDNSGTQNTNMMGGNNQGTPFAPVDLPDLNSIPTPSMMPPMGNLVAGYDNSANGMRPGAAGYGAAGVSAGAAAGASNGTGADDLMARAGFGVAQQDMQSIAGGQVTSGAARPEVDELGLLNARMKGAGTPELAAAEAAKIAELQAQRLVQPMKGDDKVAGVSGAGAAVTGKPVAAKPAEQGGVSKAAGQTETGRTTEAKPTAQAKPVTQAKPVAQAKPAAQAKATVGIKPAQTEMKKTAAKDGEAASSSLPEQKVTTGDRVAIESLLEECIRHGASDLHIQTGLPPILRIDGALRPMTMYPVLTNELVQELVFATLDEDQKKILIKDKEFDYSFAFGDLGRFRVNAFHEKGNMAAAFRLIPNVIKTVEELGLPGVVSSMADHPNGLVLVTGPTGSGKSTTLAALINKINTEKAEHIITIEDPIEFTHTSKRSVVAQREVHYDTFSFAAALRSILREDPDVVLIGEMRDLETIQAAITVAETGHLVFATLHTNSAAQSVDRMVDVFPAHQQPQIRAQLANILVGICSQRLVPAIDGGRVCVAEIMLSNAAVKSIIREGKTHQLDMTIQTGAEQGMQTMDRELAKYVKAGVISYDVAREYTVDTTEFDRLARG